MTLEEALARAAAAKGNAKVRWQEYEALSVLAAEVRRLQAALRD